MPAEILCVGEVLWDALPAGLFLGGAPLNVACHLAAMGQSVAFASRVGEDELGREIGRRLVRRGMSTDLIQVDAKLETGFVIVELDEEGTPRFAIVEPSAWDAIAPEKELLDDAGAAGAIVFGSLAQRDERSRQTIQRLWETEATRVFDVNLRPPFDHRGVVEDSLKAAHLVKLNDDELARLCGWFGLPQSLQGGALALAQEFDCQTVCVTRGSDGAALWHGAAWIDHPGFRVDVIDTVGSGDAFLAALLTGLLREDDPADTLATANALGAYVATRPGATPTHDQEAIARIRESHKR